MQYQLNIDIDSTGLNNIYASKQSVTIVKSVVSQPLQSGNLPIAWVQFQPLLTNQVTWIENYNLYATTTVLQAGAQIVQTSATPVPVQTGWTYTFAQGQFNGVTGGATGSFNLTNEQGGMFSFGLAQQAVVNNVPVLAPLNAVPVLNNEDASFTPEETISIFLSSTINNGVVLSQVASNALTVTLSSQNPSANIGFTDANNTFYLQGTSLATGEEFATRLIRAR